MGGKGYFAAHGDKPCVCFSYCSPFMGGRVSQSSQVLVHFFVCVLVTVFRVWEAVPPDQTKVQPQHLLSWHTSKPVVKCIHAQQMWDDFQSLTTRCYGTKSFQNTSLLIIQLPRLKKDLSGRIMITEKIVKSECSLLHWFIILSYDATSYKLQTPFQTYMRVRVRLNNLLFMEMDLAYTPAFCAFLTYLVMYKTRRRLRRSMFTETWQHIGLFVCLLL